MEVGGRRRERYRVQPLLAAAFRYAILAAIAAIMLFPALWMALTALKTPAEIIKVPPVLLPASPQWQNFPDAWQAAPFAQFFVNSLMVASAATLLVLLFSSLAGFAFAKLKFPLRQALFATVLATMMIPEQITFIPVFFMLKNIGLIDTRFGLVLVLSASGFGTFLMRQFFLNIPTAIMEAARIDGAGNFRIYRDIALPLSRPALATLAILTFIGAWDAFLWPLILISSENRSVITVGLARFDEQYLQQPHYTMAIATLAAAPIIALFLLAQENIVSGISVGQPHR